MSIRCFSQFGLAVDGRTFEIKDSLDEIWPLDLHSVRHKHQVNGAETLDFDGIDAIDSCQKRRSIVF